MAKRFISIWFPYLATDWFAIKQPELSHTAFVISSTSHGRSVIVASNAIAQEYGIVIGMALADARAIFPSLKVADDKPGLNEKLLTKIAEWCIRFSPFVSIDPPDGIIIDATGCSHLWGGDDHYVATISKKLKKCGYTTRIAIADSIGAVWGIARFSNQSLIIRNGQHVNALFELPPNALRLDNDTIDKLVKLGLRQVKDFISMPRSALRRRFGLQFLQRVNQALGIQEEIIQPLIPIEPYEERLPCLEPIATATGIEIALLKLLEILCKRLEEEQKGLRQAVLKCYCIDGRIESIEIGTNHPSHNEKHIFRLFESKISTIRPELGIELFVLIAPKVEDVQHLQQKIWENPGGLNNIRLAELLDRIAGKVGENCIHRYLPDEHYWPERSFKQASTLNEKSSAQWIVDKPRPIQLLPNAEKIAVTAPIPDYPPMNFRYKGKLHIITNADGPERIEQEWWLQQGQHRDYYYVEDEEGKRYWIFRLGHYDDKSYQWFIHGFFP